MLNRLRTSVWACVGLAITLADGPVTSRRDGEERAASIPSDLGYVDREARALDRRAGAALSAPLTTALEQIGLWCSGHRRRDTVAGGAHRALARLALR